MKKRVSFVLLPILSFCLSSCVKVPNEVKIVHGIINIKSIHTSYQQDYLAEEDPTDYINEHYYDFNNPAKVEGNITSIPVPTRVTFEVETDNGANATSYIVRYGESSDKLDSSYTVNDKYADLYNLKMNTTYFYQVEAVYGKTGFKSEINTFKTYSDTKLRNMYVPGVENFRDLGGYVLENGKHFKQGMLYRSAQFNYDTSKDNAIKSAPNEEGKRVLLENLKIKTDADFREKSNKKGEDETAGLSNTSPLGSQVKYAYLPMRYGGSNVITETMNKDSILTFLNLLADESNYPVVFHCIQGKDRTGALAYVIEALLGVSEDSMKRDYLFTNFAQVGAGKTSFPDGSAYYPRQISNEEGSTISEKARNYLKKWIGVSDQTLDKIINILSEQ